MMFWIFILASFLLRAQNIPGFKEINPLNVEFSAETFQDNQEDLYFERLENLLSWAPRPNSKVITTVTYEKEKKLSFKWEYNINSLGLRVVPNDVSKSNQYHFFLVGDSNSFGDLLNDNQTLAYHLEKQAPEFAYYIFAYSGYGLSQDLAWFHYFHNNQETQIIPKKGVMLINVYDFLIFRSTCTLWGLHQTKGMYLQLVDSQNFTFKKCRSDLWNGARYLMFLIKMGMMKIESLFVDKDLFPLRYEVLQSQEIDEFLDLLVAFENLYKRFYPQGHFVIMNNPLDFELFQKYNPDLYTYMQKKIREKNLLFLDLPHGRLSPERTDLLFFDAHINELGNKMLAEDIIIYLYELEHFNEQMAQQPQ